MLGCCRAWGEGRAAATRGNRPLTAAVTLRTLSQPPTPSRPADPARRWLRRQETHGLTALGQQQARDSVRQLASIPARRVAFLTSDFTRARETAEIAAAGLEEHWLREGSLNRGGGGEGHAL